MGYHRLCRHRGVRLRLFLAAGHRRAQLDFARDRAVLRSARPDVRSTGGVDRGMFPGPVALQRLLDGLSVRFRYRLRSSTADSDSTACGVWIGLHDRCLHPFLCDSQLRDSIATGLHEPRHLVGSSKHERIVCVADLRN
jgi:hypothetical protein